jgi:hypothetical protein
MAQLELESEFLTKLYYTPCKAREMVPVLFFLLVVQQLCGWQSSSLYVQDNSSTESNLYMPFKVK